jgi:putative transposase
LQQVALDLSSAFLNFFEKRTMFPKFKKKHNRQSMRLPQGCKLADDYINLPKLGKVYCKVSRKPVGKLKSVTVSLTPSGQYYVSCLFDDEQDLPEKNCEGKAIGVDIGLTHFAITSDGSKFDNPKYYRKYEVKLGQKQKRLSKKQKGSKNKDRVKIEVAKIHEKITRCREDFLHKLSRNLVNENQVICVENLAVKNMVRNHKLSKSISDCGWGQFLTMLKYKAEREGKIYIEVDRFFPSSKICSNCLHQIDKMPLDLRSWTCPNCQIHHDRDINAAINIREEGLRIMAVGHIASASRERVRPSRGTAFVGHFSVKDESPTQ